MPDGTSLYDSASFWALAGGGSAVIGGIFIGVGVGQVDKVPQGSDWSNPWFDVGVAAVIVGGAAILWAIVLFTAHRHVLAHDRRPVTWPISLPKLAPSSPPVQARTPLPEPTSAPRVESHLSPAQLKALFDNVTDVQGDRLAAPYLGKWITVSGVVANVDSIPGKVRILLRDDTSVFPWFEGAEAERASLCVAGIQVTVHGRIDRINRNGVSLDNCEIIGG